MGDQPKPVLPKPSTPSSSAGSGERAPPDPLIGRVINERFRILATIARGGMGKVYRAEQSPLGRLVALKVLSPTQTAGGELDFHKRFFLEASVCAKLSHPNTVTVFDYGRTEDEIYYIAMELLEGRTLSRAIRDEAPFEADRAVHIIRQICRSLREAHGLGLIHRDLKPANVYLVKHGDEVDFVKVLDFGLVKDIEDTAESITQTGLFMGSPKYMSPEQIRGEPVDGRSDVYSVGVLMYEMLTGKVPFDRATTMNILMAHVQEPVPAMSQIAPNVEVPAGLEEVVLHCLAKSPSERFASVDAILERLRQASAGAGMDVPTSGEMRNSLQSGKYQVSDSRIESPTFLSDVTLTLSPSQPPNFLPVLSPALQPPLHPQLALQPVATATPPRAKWKAPLFAVVGLLAVLVVVTVLALGRSESVPPAVEQRTPTNVPPTPRPIAPLRVVLRSSPPGALVRLGERELGVTPLELAWTGGDAAPGRVLSFRFRRDGYSELVLERTLSGEPLEIAATLVELPSQTPNSPARPIRPRPRPRPTARPGDPVGAVHGFKNDPY